ncbi:E3 ubiquitin-protein ligase Mdm2-like [Diorhabda carinulata]|uniref:E3 ubiquitin-protein ligase Mdm2-like n=1 Tax=Diorhabda carinulata TaxID=1163345 RepID=UPI0025A17F50|nr:E3 ubiquitin-protein ligase Mdm2-like [Diorhabda carinulata]
MSELKLKMSAAVDTSNVSWKKRKHPGDPSRELKIEMKRPRYYYYRLASESSRGSEEDTESVYSVQDHETDVAKDTTDTDSKSDDNEDIELIEYEVASLSEGSVSSGSTASETDDQVIFAAAIEAICDSSIETWITDGEESDSSSFENTSINTLGFVTCVQCKSINDNPLYRYCEKCFQNRKKFYPPRPRGNKKSKKKVDDPVKLDTLRSCLSGLSSLDSGVGSSQECPPLDLDQIVVPDKHLKSGMSISDVGDLLLKENAAEEHGSKSKRKRQASESSLSDFDVKKRKLSSPSNENSVIKSDENIKFEISQNENAAVTSENDQLSNQTSETSELCIICNGAPKNSIFIHTNIAHQCCCYKCAKRTLRTTKRCPICNRYVNKVLKLFTA